MNSKLSSLFDNKICVGSYDFDLMKDWYSVLMIAKLKSNTVTHLLKVDFNSSITSFEVFSQQICLFSRL